MEVHVLARALLAATLAACACGRSATPGPAPAPPPAAAPQPAPAAQPAAIGDRDAAMAALGTRVRVQGTAENDKLSAAVSTGRLNVYCLDLAGWAGDQAGKPVVVEGTLERTNEFEARNEGGVVSQGTGGAVFVIRQCTVVR